MKPGSSLLQLSMCAVLGAACDAEKPNDGPAAAAAASKTAAPPASAAAPRAPDAAPSPTAAALPAAPAALPAAAAVPPADVAAKAAEPTVAKRPPELEALETTITPILAMTDEDARTKAACKALATITSQIADVRKHPPQGVDAGAWGEIAERMAGGLNDFEIECGEGSASNTRALADAAETRKELDALLAK